MESLLVLVHRIPYPPNKGDKIRSFNFIKHLARDYHIHLGAFVDDPHDWQYRNVIEELCQDACLLGIKPSLRKIKSLAGLMTGQALSVPYYWDKNMASWVNQKIKHENIKRVFVYSSQMAQYVMGDEYSGIKRVVDFVDVDSEKWHQYAESHSWPMNWIYSREGSRLLDYDKQVASEFDVSCFVSEEESKVFKKLAPESSDRITYIYNGVDNDYFSPDNEYVNPYKGNEKVLVFTGAMDYWANIDAVTWFANEIFPSVRKNIRDASFYIVGARPTPAVKKLAVIDGVHVTGSVKDIRSYMHYAEASVAPMRVARGLQNKVLEAMSMSKIVLATSAAMEGIGNSPDIVTICNTENEYINTACNILRHAKSEEQGANARKMVIEHFSWKSHLQKFEKLLEQGA